MEGETWLQGEGVEEGGEGVGKLPIVGEKRKHKNE